MEEEERRERRAKRSTLKEVLDHLGFSEVDGLMALVILHLSVSSMGLQDHDDFNFLRQASPHQSGPTFVRLIVEITSQTNQTISNRDMTVDLQSPKRSTQHCHGG